MPHHEAMTSPGEPAVGDQGHLIAESASHDGARRTQHLTHARAAAGTLPADHHDISGPHCSAEDCACRPLLSREDSRPTLEALAFLPRNLGDCAFRCEVPVEDDEVTVLLQRSRERLNNVLPTHIHRNIFE